MYAVTRAEHACQRSPGKRDSSAQLADVNLEIGILCGRDSLFVELGDDEFAQLGVRQACHQVADLLWGNILRDFDGRRWWFAARDHLCLHW